MTERRARRRLTSPGPPCTLSAACPDGRSARYLDPRNFHRYFNDRAEKAGVPVISVHSTRRTCASLLVALDVHPRVAMAILRHSQIAVTMDIYSQVSSASTREALKRLGSQFEEGLG